MAPSVRDWGYSNKIEEASRVETEDCEDKNKEMGSGICRVSWEQQLGTGTPQPVGR